MGRVSSVPFGANNIRTYRIFGNQPVDGSLQMRRGESRCLGLEGGRKWWFGTCADLLK